MLSEILSRIDHDSLKKAETDFKANVQTFVGKVLIAIARNPDLRRYLGIVAEQWFQGPGLIGACTMLELIRRVPVFNPIDSLESMLSRIDQQFCSDETTIFTRDVVSYVREAGDMIKNYPPLHLWLVEKARENQNYGNGVLFILTLLLHIEKKAALPDTDVNIN